MTHAPRRAPVFLVDNGPTAIQMARSRRSKEANDYSVPDMKEGTHTQKVKGPQTQDMNTNKHATGPLALWSQVCHSGPWLSRTQGYPAHLWNPVKDQSHCTCTSSDIRLDTWQKYQHLIKTNPKTTAMRRNERRSNKCDALSNAVGE